jgi:hypothetical protein
VSSAAAWAGSKDEPPALPRSRATCWVVDGLPATGLALPFCAVDGGGGAAAGSAARPSASAIVAGAFLSVAPPPPPAPAAPPLEPPEGATVGRSSANSSLSAGTTVTFFCSFLKLVPSSASTVGSSLDCFASSR